MRRILAVTSHRPFALPTGPWVMRQTWSKLLFAHWQVDAKVLQALLPAGLQVDTFDGRAYVGVVPFAMTNVRPRFAPAVPWLSNFLELNLRTYVRPIVPQNQSDQDKPGVYFFSLDAANPIAVALARKLFHLPYFNARMTLQGDPGSWVNYQSKRCHRGSQAVQFQGRYRPRSGLLPVAKGSLEEFLTERYCLYVSDDFAPGGEHTGGRLYRGNIHHAPWPLQEAEAEITVNTIAEPYGLDLSAPPLLHYAEAIDTVEWPLSAL